MIKIIDNTSVTEWDRLVKTFDNYDVYYLNGYVQAFKINGDGEPFLLYAEHNSARCMCVFLKRIILSDKLDRQYYDLTTPYGYGGFVFEKNSHDTDNIILLQEIIKYFYSFDIVSAFIRWHPILNNAHSADEVIPIINIGQTVHIDTSMNVNIWDNIACKNRTAIRNSIKKGVSINHSNDARMFSVFKEIYDATMLKDNASSYYFFKKEFYDSISNDLRNNYEIFYAQVDDEIISMAIMLHSNKFMHYHLSGIKTEYRSYNATNLLLYEAAKWAQQNGFNCLHLGGGLGAAHDNLYRFKKAFNRANDNNFYISKLVINHNIYNKLVNERIDIDAKFNIDSSYFPLYRS